MTTKKIMTMLLIQMMSTTTTDMMPTITVVYIYIRIADVVRVESS